MMLTPMQAAEYLLHLTEDTDEGELLTNLKLQKLLYYAQCAHLARFGTPLFSGEVEAWKHGPVVRAVYEKYQKYGAKGIPRLGDVDLSEYPATAIDTLNRVYAYFGQFSATKLRDMTHEETPWLEADHTAGCASLSQDAMRKSFARNWSDALLTEDEVDQIVVEMRTRPVQLSERARRAVSAFKQRSFHPAPS